MRTLAGVLIVAGFLMAGSPAEATECSDLLMSIEKRGRDAYAEAWLTMLNASSPDTEACNLVAAPAVADAVFNSCKSGAVSPNPAAMEHGFIWGVVCEMSAYTGSTPQRAYQQFQPCLSSERGDFETRTNRCLERIAPEPKP
jgi:hypothetical protein